MGDMKKQKILMVIDVQNDFITGALRNEEAIKALPNIVKLVKDGNWDEIYATMDTHHKATYLTGTLEGIKLPIEHCIKGTDGWKMPKEMTDALEQAGVVVSIFKKETFGSDWMVNNIRATHNIDTTADPRCDCSFTIVGFCTDICVISNALMLRALFPNSHIAIVKDCVAGTTPEANEAALMVLRNCQIDIV